MIIRDVSVEESGCTWLLKNHDGEAFAGCSTEEIANNIANRLNRESCIWKFRDSDHSYETSCGKAFQFNEGDATANGVTHCMYCGCPIEDMDE